MNKQYEKKSKYIVYLILFTEISLLVYVTWRWGVHRIDSDDSAEMILANLLSREGGILSRNWYYSTEMRVLNTQIITSCLFRVFSDWHTVRTVSTGIHLILLAVSYLFLCHSIPEGERFYWWAPVILLPFSYVYYDIVLFGLHYIFNLCILFTSLGLILKETSGVQSYLGKIVLAVLAFLAGMNGLRIPVIGYLPMFLACLSCVCLKCKNKGILCRTIIAGVASFAGWLVNSRILSKYYSFVLWNQTRLTIPQPARVIEILRDTLQFFGVSYPTVSLKGAAAFAGMFIFLVTIFCIVIILRKRKNISDHFLFLIFFFLWSWLITAGIGICTTQPWANRYMIMPCIGFVLILCEGISLVSGKTLQKYLYAACTCALLLCGAAQYRIFIGNDKLKYVQSAFDYILNSDLHFGFGDWDASDSLTELSNGSVHMCKLNNYKDVTVWYWLMEKDYQKYAGDDPVFLLIAKDRLNFAGNIGHVYGEWTEEDLTWLKNGNLSYEDKYYRIYTYPSLEYFEEVTKQE